MDAYTNVCTKGIVATAPLSELVETIITEDELKNTDVIFGQRSNGKERSIIFDKALADWSDFYEQASNKDKKTVARSLIADVTQKGVRFLAVTDRLKKLYTVKHHDAPDVIIKVMKALCRVVRSRRATMYDNESRSLYFATEKEEPGVATPPTVQPASVDAHMEIKKTASSSTTIIRDDGRATLEEDFKDPQEDGTIETYETPSWVKNTREFTETAEEAEKFEDFAAGLDILLSHEQMNSPTLCGRTTTVPPFWGPADPNPETLSASRREIQAVVDTASTCCPGIEQEGSADEAEDTLHVPAELFDGGVLSEGPTLVKDKHDYLRVDSLRQKMFAPARRLQSRRKKAAVHPAHPKKAILSTNALTEKVTKMVPALQSPSDALNLKHKGEHPIMTPIEQRISDALDASYMAEIPRMTPAEQRLSDALDASYKAEQELSVALIRYERTITANPLPRALALRKRDLLRDDERTGIPVGWDFKAAACRAIKKSKQN